MQRERYPEDSSKEKEDQRKSYFKFKTYGQALEATFP
jgi:hypothetical protein